MSVKRPSMKEKIIKKLKSLKFYMIFIPILSATASYIWTGIGKTLINGRIFSLGQKGLWNQFSYYLYLFTINWFIGNIFYAFFRFLQAKLKPKIKTAVNEIMMEKIQEVSPMFIKTKGTNDFRSYILYLSRSLYRVIHLFLFTFLPSIIFFISMIIRVSRFESIYFALSLIVWVISSIILIFLNKNKQMNLTKKTLEDKVTYKRQLDFTAKYYIDYYFYNSEKYLINKLQKTSDNSIASQYNLKISEFYVLRWVDVLIFLFCGIAVIFVAINYLPKGLLSIESFLAFFSMQGSIVFKTVHAISHITDVFQHLGVLNKSIKYFDSIPYYKTEGKEITNVEKISIKNLSLTQGGKELFRDFNSEIHAGQIVVIMGPSGCGKSTLIKLLSGISETQYTGSILYNNDEVSTLNKKAISRLVNYFDQDNTLTNNTIRHNLTLGKDIDEKKLWAILKDLDLFETINNKEKKLDTVIGTQGYGLSQGEQQRLTFARFVLSMKEKQVVIFDELTQNLDQKSIKKIFRVLLKVIRTKKIIVIFTTHNIELLKIANLIYFYDNRQKKWITGPLETIKKTSPVFKIWQY